MHHPQPPNDPVGAAVYTVLEKHCARCHQGDQWPRRAAAAALGDILRLDELANMPHLVQPGNPDASPLYLTMLRRLMPLDARGEGARAPRPTADEIASVRSWIAGLPPRHGCPDRPPVTPADHAATLMELQNAAREDPAKLRFLSIAHLHNSCVGSAKLAAYGQAVAQLMNSLSWKVAPIAVPAIDPARTLFKINLDDLGWQPEHWDRIMSRGALFGLVASLPEAVRSRFGSATPLARADWFANAVLSAPLYYDVLGLPATEAGILQILNAPEASVYARGILVPSSSVPSPAIVERSHAPGGIIWRSYYWSSADQPDANGLDLHVDAIEVTPRYRAARVMFTLPNGFPAYYFLDNSGNRLDFLPLELARAPVTRRMPTAAGFDCLPCLGAGVKRLNWIRPETTARALEADSQLIASSMRRAGTDPDLMIGGAAPMVALAGEYIRPVDAIRAAGELGITLDALRDLANRDAEDAVSIFARRLVQGLVSRVEVEERGAELMSALGIPNLTPRPSAPARPSDIDKPAMSGWIDPGPILTLFSDKASYRKGDSIQLTVRTTVNCHLTIVSIDTRGRGTVLFPSDFETDGRLSAGQSVKLPGADALYGFRLNHPGRETIVAICNELGPLTDNIRHDYERQRFTDLGDYATFVAQNALLEGTVAVHPPPSSGSRRRSTNEPAPEPRARPDQVFRTAIRVLVE